MKKLFLLISLLCLVGCQSTAEREAEKARRAFKVYEQMIKDFKEREMDIWGRRYHDYWEDE